MEYIIAAGLIVIVGYILWKKRKKKTDSHETETDTKPETRPDPQPNPEPFPDDTVLREYPVYWFENGEKVEGTCKEMPQGLQVFDKQGNIILDVTEGIAKIAGQVTINATTGAIESDLIHPNNTWYLYVYPSFYLNGINIATPDVTVEEGVLKWSVQGNGTLGGTLYWGIY